MHYVYILKCKDSTLYTGYTTKLAERIHKHNKGEGAKYTRGRTPVSLVHFEVFFSKEEAMRREYEIKQWSKKRKEALIQKTLNIQYNPQDLSFQRKL
ncbi:GIY-YIG nuclease family protein [Microaerobacter geothermalis]|uniref:GIY-YIG nuclease family protein n=1 Tax=Microaerobacter geothermalis TaxID=674972 RepID=UPI0038B23CB5